VENFNTQGFPSLGFLHVGGTNQKARERDFGEFTNACIWFGFGYLL